MTRVDVMNIEYFLSPFLYSSQPDTYKYTLGGSGGSFANFGSQV